LFLSEDLLDYVGRDDFIDRGELDDLCFGDHGLEIRAEC
jgi:hypothetical protein